MQPSPRRILAILSLALVGLYGPSPARAQIYFALPDNPLYLAQAHCRMLARDAQDPGIWTFEELEAFLRHNGGRQQPTEQQLQHMLFVSEGFPEFGFVIGPRWEVLTREQRLAFNKVFFTQVLREHLGELAKKGASMPCDLDVTTTQMPQEELTHLDHNEQHSFPQPAAYEASAHALLPGGGYLHYTLRSLPRQHWEITDMLVGDVSLVETYQKPFNTIIAEQGFDALLETLGKRK